MQDRSELNDPQLEALAQQLASALPRLGAAERDAILYECGFAAGRQSSVRPLRRWQAVAASLALVAAGLGVMSATFRNSPLVGQVAVVPQVVPESVTAKPNAVTPNVAGPQDGPLYGRLRHNALGHDGSRPDMLLANSSWEKVRATLKSPPRTVEVSAYPEATPRRARISANSAWNDLELSR